MKACIVFNSLKNTSYFVQNLYKVIYELNVQGYEVIIRASLKSKDIQHYIQALDECEVIVVSGGDGTIHEVANGLCLNDRISPKILYFASGTVNDIAHSLNLKPDIEYMLDLLRNDEYKIIDCGRINDKYFVYVAAFGMFTQASYNTSDRQKAHLKSAAYVLNGITELPNISNSYHLKIEIDDNEQIIGDFQLGLISNSASVAGLRNLFRDDEMDDGYFNLYLTSIDLKFIEQALKTLKNGITSANESEGTTVVRKFKRLKIEASSDLCWTIDGEKGYNGSINIEVIDKKLKIYTPNKESLC